MSKARFVQHTQTHSHIREALKLRAHRCGSPTGRGDISFRTVAPFDMEETYQIRDDDETRTAMDDLDAFEQRLNSGNPRAPKPASKAVPQRVKPAMPVVRKKGSDYVGAAVKAKPSKADDEGFALDTSDKVSDMKAVSDLDRFDDGNISE